MSKERGHRARTELPPVDPNDRALQNDFIEAVSTSRTGEGLQSYLKNLGIPVALVPALMGTARVFGYAEEVFSYPDPGFEGAALLALSGREQVERLDLSPPDYHFTDQAVEVDLGGKGWSLCPTAEGRLDTALGEDGVLVLTDDENEPVLLQKFRGKNVALCVKDTVGVSGKGFLAGHWYAPATRKTVKAVNRAYDAGEGRTELMTSGWTLLRPVKTRHMEGLVPRDEFMADVVERSDEIPPAVDDRPLDSVAGTVFQARFEYRRKNYERITIG